MVTRDILVRAISNRDILQTKWHDYYLDENGEFVVEDAIDDLVDEISSGHRRGTQFFALYWSAHFAGDVPILLNTIASTYLDVLQGESDKNSTGSNLSS